jgi:hypothetical protein
MSQGIARACSPSDRLVFAANSVYPGIVSGFSTIFPFFGRLSADNDGFARND